VNFSRSPTGPDPVEQPVPASGGKQCESARSGEEIAIGEQGFNPGVTSSTRRAAVRLINRVEHNGRDALTCDLKYVPPIADTQYCRCVAFIGVIG